MDNQLWECKDGSFIRLQDMSLSHLNNSLNMVIEKRLNMSDSAEAYWTCAMIDEIDKRKLNKIKEFRKDVGL